MKKKTLNRVACLAASILLIFHMIPLQVFAAEQPKTETEGIELKAESKPDAEEIFTGEKTLLRTSVIQGNGEYLYKYCRQEISDDSEEEVSDGQASMEQPAEEDVDFNETVLQEYSTQDYCEIQEDSAGEYTYYTYVKDSSGQTVKIESTILVKEADGEQEMPGSESDEDAAGEQIPVQDDSAVQPGAADSLEEAEPEQPVRETGLQGTLAGSRGAQSYENRGVVLTADVKGGDGKYTYRFRHSYNGKTETVQDYGSSAEYRFTASGIGTHIYYADVQDGAGRKLTLNFTMKVTAEPVVKLQGTLTGSRGSQSYENRGVVLTAAVTQGSGGYTYRFRHSYNGKTETVQDYGSSAEYRFTTSGIGNHTYYVDIRDWKGQTLTLSFAMKVTAEPVVKLQGTLTGSRGSQSYENRGVVLTAAVTQGSGGYTYRFRHSYNGKTETVQDYGSSAEYRFTTSGIGSHIYYVDIRDWKGQTLTLSFAMKVTAEPVVKLQGTLTGSRGSQSYENRGVVLTAAVTQGSGGYTYRFRHSYNGKTETVQEYGNSAEYSFTTSGVGSHTYYVDIRDWKGQVLTLSFAMKVTAEPVAELQGTLTGSRGGQAYENRGITLTAAVTQGNGGYEYRFRHNYNGKTDTVQEYSGRPTYQFTTSGVGNHIYYADIRDWKGKSITLSFAMKVTPEPVAELQGTLTGSRGTSVYVNRGVTLTAAVTQGNGGYEYRFRESYNGASKVLQDYGAKSTYVFTTSGVGTHAYYVDVRDAKGKTCTLRYDIKVTAEPGYALKAELTGSRTGNVFMNRGVTLTASAHSGYGEYQYQFAQEYNGYRRVVREYSADNTYSFTTGMAGAYTYIVTVRDKQGATASASWKLIVVSDGSQTYGIDVSKWNGDVNWKQVRDQGVQFAMIRCSSDQGNKDSKFEQNYAGAKAQGLRVGVYHYSYATTVEEARKEAQFVIKTLNNRNLDLPVAFDIEDPGAHYPLTKSQATAVAKAFCEEIKKAGYVPMVYSMQSFFTTHLDYSQLSGYKMWVARWKADSPGVNFPVDMWQFSDQGNVPGANTSTGCDVNYAFGL